MAKIIIVEDDPDTAKLLHKRLTDAGYEVYTAPDAYQGIDAVKKQMPDLIILDLMLPAGGGLAVLSRIKLFPTTKFIPIVVLTGMKDENYKKEVLSKGVDAYLQKPYEITELLSTIKNILSR